MTISVRALTAGDAAEVIRMWRDFGVYLRALGDTDEQNFSIEKFLADGFGADPAFFGFIAESEGKAIGYLLYYYGYAVDLATRAVHIADLWVEPSARRGGVGRKLMSAAAGQGRAKGATLMIWAVFAPNKLATDFYERLGARFLNDLPFMQIPVAALAP